MFAFVLSSLDVCNPSAEISEDKLSWHTAVCPESVHAQLSRSVLFGATGADSAAEAAAIKAAAIKAAEMLSSKDIVTSGTGTPPSNSDSPLSTPTTTHSTMLSDQGGSTEQHDVNNSQELEANPGVAPKASKKRPHTAAATQISAVTSIVPPAEEVNSKRRSTRNPAKDQKNPPKDKEDQPGVVPT